jgi:hypothetical protein
MIIAAVTTSAMATNDQKLGSNPSRIFRSTSILKSEGP